MNQNIKNLSVPITIKDCGIDLPAKGIASIILNSTEYNVATSGNNVIYIPFAGGTPFYDAGYPLNTKFYGPAVVIGASTTVDGPTSSSYNIVFDKPVYSLTFALWAVDPGENFIIETNSETEVLIEANLAYNINIEKNNLTCPPETSPGDYSGGFFTVKSIEGFTSFTIGTPGYIAGSFFHILCDTAEDVFQECPVGPEKNQHSYTLYLGPGTGDYLLSYDLNSCNSPFAAPSKVSVNWDGKEFTTGFRGSSSYDGKLLNLNYPPTLNDITKGLLLIQKDKSSPTTASLVIDTPFEECAVQTKLLCPESGSGSGSGSDSLCSRTDNFCFSDWAGLYCGCVFDETSIITGNYSESYWAAFSMEYTGENGDCDSSGNCYMKIIRGENSLLHPASSNWIIGESVSLNTTIGSKVLSTKAIVCDKTYVGEYEALVLKCPSTIDSGSDSDSTTPQSNPRNLCVAPEPCPILAGVDYLSTPGPNIERGPLDKGPKGTNVQLPLEPIGGVENSYINVEMAGLPIDILNSGEADTLVRRFYDVTAIPPVTIKSRPPIPELDAQRDNYITPIEVIGLSLKSVNSLNTDMGEYNIYVGLQSYLDPENEENKSKGTMAIAYDAASSFTRLFWSSKFNIKFVAVFVPKSIDMSAWEASYKSEEDTWTAPSKIPIDPDTGEPYNKGLVHYLVTHAAISDWEPTILSQEKLEKIRHYEKMGLNPPILTAKEAFIRTMQSMTWSKNN